MNMTHSREPICELSDSADEKMGIDLREGEQNEMTATIFKTRANKSCLTSYDYRLHAG